MPACTSLAQRSASTTLLNSTSKPSPVVLTMWPLCAAIVGSNSSARIALNAWRVPPSSSPISREYPATSAARIAARRRSTGCFMASPRRADHSTTATASTGYQGSQPRGWRRTCDDGVHPARRTGRDGPTAPKGRLPLPTTSSATASTPTSGTGHCLPPRPPARPGSKCTCNRIDDCGWGSFLGHAGSAQTHIKRLLSKRHVV